METEMPWYARGMGAPGHGSSRQIAVNPKSFRYIQFNLFFTDGLIACTILQEWSFGVEKIDPKLLLRDWLKYFSSADKSTFNSINLNTGRMLFHLYAACASVMIQLITRRTSSGGDASAWISQ
jgi:hypothetical protein